DEGRLAVARHAGDAHLGWIDARIGIGFEIVDQAAHAPGPGTERAPVFGAARLAFVAKADDAFAQPAAIALNAGRDDRAVAPAFVERLLRPPPRYPPFERGGWGGAALASETSLAAEPAAEAEAVLQDDRHLAGGVLGNRETSLDRDLDLRKGAVVHVTDERLSDRGD